MPLPIFLLHTFCWQGAIDKVRGLLDTADSSCCELFDDRGRLPIHCAVLSGRLELVQLILLVSPGTLDEPERANGATALILAAAAGFSDVLQALLEHGASVTEANFKGHTALHEACRAPDAECALLLLRNGAHPEVRTNQGLTALHIAAMYGRAGSLALLLEYGANVYARDNNGLTPLDMLEWHNSHDIYTGVCEYVADPATWPVSLKRRCRATLLRDPNRRALVEALPEELADYVENLAHHGLPPGPPLAPPGRLHPDTVHAIMARTQATYADVLRAMRACRNNVPEAVARLLPRGQAQRGQDII